jgi:pyruvate dehydrogenase E1 component alpha subunit
VTAAFFSDGASNNGVFAEAMNLAAIWDLPLILVLENNHYAVSTPVEDVSRTADLCERGKGYGVESFTVDGNDVLKVHERASCAAEKCRAGKGPILMECKTYRDQGHHVNDPGDYMPKDVLEQYKARNPELVCRRYMTGEAGMTDEQINAIEAEVDSALEEAVEFARNSPEPDLNAFLSEVESY